jgi:hypothetical protein
LSAGDAGGSTSQPDSGPPTAVAPVTAVTSESIEPEPVYNLTVAGAHEFYAEGMLVHNCSWNPDTDKSPDRMDALVWGISELMVSGAPLSGYYRSEIERLRAAREKAKETAA